MTYPSIKAKRAISTLSYLLHKNSIKLEKYITVTKNKAISRILLSSHPLMIEKGRHQNPPLTTRNEMPCPHCINLVEDELADLSQC